MVAPQVKLDGDVMSVDWSFSAKTGMRYEAQWTEGNNSTYKMLTNNPTLD